MHSVAMEELTKARHVTEAGTLKMTLTLVVQMSVSCGRVKSAGKVMSMEM